MSARVILEKILLQVFLSVGMKFLLLKDADIAVFVKNKIAEKTDIILKRVEPFLLFFC